MTQELEELAARGQKSKRKREEKRRGPEPRPAPAKSELSKTVKVSLQGPWLLYVMFAVSVLGMAPALIAYTVGVSKTVQIVSFLVPFAAGVAGALAYKQLSLYREVAWVKSMPFGFDPGAYLEALDHRRTQGAFTVGVQFEGPVPESARDTIANAAIGACDAEGAKFKGEDRLVVRSPRLRTYFEGSKGDSESTSHYSNRLLHQWFRKLVDGGLKTIDSSYKIRSVTVST